MSNYKETPLWNNHLPIELRLDYLIREMTDYSLPKIGQMFGGKHYTTVMYACDKIEGEMKADPSFAQRIEQMKDEIMD